MSTEGSRKPLEAPLGPPVRLTPVALPSYRYVPGVTPHPVTDPMGHSHGVREEVADLTGRVLPDDWRRVEEYLLGVDLFNRAFFWEAHESWEAVWHAAGKESVPGRFLQGMIQVSAALLQRHCGRLRGAGNLLAKAEDNLGPASIWMAEYRAPTYMGVDLADWLPRVRGFIEGSSDDFPFLLARP